MVKASMRAYDLTKEQWKRVKPLLPPPRADGRGRPRKNDRTMLNGMLWVVRNGAHWRMLPRKYGPWQSVYARFAKWRRDGTLVAVLLALSGEKTIKEAGTSRS